MAYFYVYTMYAAHFSLVDDCENFSDGFVRAAAYLVRPKGLMLTGVVGVPLYVLAHEAVWVAASLALFWVVVWVIEMREIIGE